ncbi:MAG: HEAT repeat domain-containing protein [Myxococcales bacterium]|nr:HEAT repeat domain-containing protein [Myxococcales bacterium]
MSAFRNVLVSLMVGGALLVAPNALADGISIAPSVLPNDARSKLENDIAAAKVAQPKAFEAVKNVKGHRPESYRKNRNPFPTVSRELRGLGAPALLPMLEALAFKAPARGSLTAAEWDALASGMLEAVGILRDPRGGVVAAAIFESSVPSAQVRMAAARALGRVGGDAELKLLTSHAKTGDPLLLSAVHGLGEMMRIESAKHLAALLESTKDANVAEAAISALGTVGSSWAWKSLGPKAAATGLEVRKLCADAVVPRFARDKGSLRTAAREAILIVDHPETVSLLASARSISGADVKAVDSMIQKVERQQSRQKR